MKKALASLLALTSVVAVGCGSSGITHTDDRLGFEVTFAENWTGYETQELTSGVQMGFDDENGNFYSLLVVNKIPAGELEMMTEMELNFVEGYEVARSDEFVYTYAPATHDAPPAGMEDQLQAAMDAKETFEIL